MVREGPARQAAFDGREKTPSDLRLWGAELTNSFSSCVLGLEDRYVHLRHFMCGETEARRGGDVVEVREKGVAISTVGHEQMVQFESQQN